jgi:hypothetical protein
MDKLAVRGIRVFINPSLHIASNPSIDFPYIFFQINFFFFDIEGKVNFTLSEYHPLN